MEAAVEAFFEPCTTYNYVEEAVKQKTLKGTNQRGK